MKISQKLKSVSTPHGGRWANDNISKYSEEGDKQKLIEEAMPLLKTF